MAKSAKSKQLPVSDQTLWYQNLSYLPADYKESRIWMAQMLVFIKSNSQRLQDRERALVYRRTDTLTLDKQLYKNLIDPPTSKEFGGDAAYFSSDFKALPIDTHLDNILEGTIRTILQKITCSLADPIAKLQEQKDKEKIVAQEMVRGIINGLMEELGKKPIPTSSDPYKWIQNFTAKDGKPKVDEVGDVIDQIKNKIHDDDNLRLFQNYLYKNGIEIAFEVAIKYYLLDQNEFETKYAPLFFNDIKHFNKFSGRWAIDEMTGQGMVKYIDPSELFTSPFKDRNGDDIIYWFYEENVTMAEFERLVGADMTDKEKKKALDLQKKQGWSTGANYSNNSNQNSSQIRIGFMSVLSQEANAYSEKYLNKDVSVMDNKPLTWEPDADADETKKVKVYNVWHTCYYMPLSIYSFNSNSPVDWAEQSKYIFRVRKDLDMMRTGVDNRYAKSSLVIWKNEKQASWTDIKESFMPKIHTLWHKFQNCIVQDIQAIVFDQDLLGGMLNAIDEANISDPKGGTKVVNEFKQLRQAGFAFLKFRDKNGNLTVDPKNLMIPIDNGQLKKGEMYLQLILSVYNLMSQSLAKGGAGEGIQPEARTPAAGIEASMKAADKATYFIEESYTEGVVVQYAYRAAQHIHTICKERKKFGFTERWKIFNDVIGRYNGAVLEGIEDINFENIGLTISSEDDTAKKNIILQQIMNRYAQKAISTAGLGLVLGTANWKLWLVELALEEQKAQEIAQAQAQQQQQNIMEQKAADLKTAQALNDSKAEGKNKNIAAQGQVDSQIAALTNQLKQKSMELQKQQLLNNKLTENQQKSELQKDNSTHDSNLKQQEGLEAA